MGRGEHERIDEGASGHEIADPGGHFQGALDQAGQFQGFGAGQMGRASHMLAQQDPNAFMNQFQQAAPGLANMVSGQMSPLQQQMNALASDQARRGAEMAGQQFANQGALGSGAASRAMGTAMAQPFADVQQQLGQQQLGMTGDLWGQSMGQFGQAQAQRQQQLMQQMGMGADMMGQGLQTQAGLAGQLGGLVAPQYDYRPSGGEQFLQMAPGLLGAGIQAAGALKGG